MDGPLNAPYDVKLWRIFKTSCNIGTKQLLFLSFWYLKMPASSQYLHDGLLYCNVLLICLYEKALVRKKMDHHAAAYNGMGTIVFFALFVTTPK
jgi:hypothetical protein